MPWTNPAAHVYATNETLTASTLNTYVQQNLAFLGGPYYARAYQTTGTNQSISPNTLTTVTLNAIDFDPNNNFSTSTNAYTCPAGGRYHVDASVLMVPLTGYLQAYVLINGVLKSGNQATAYGIAGSASVSATIQANGGDAITIQTRHSDGFARTTSTANGTGVDVWFSIALLGPT